MRSDTVNHGLYLRAAHSFKFNCLLVFFVPEPVGVTRDSTEDPLRHPLRTQALTFAGGGGYMREIGTMWQIGVLTGKPCTLLVQNGLFSAFWHCKKKGETFEGFGRKMAHFIYLS